MEQPSFINEFSSALLSEFYMLPGETVNDCFARAANAFCYGDFDLRDRIIGYLHNNWMMFASPIISNAAKGEWVLADATADWNKQYTFIGEKSLGMPISCFGMMVDDTLVDQIKASEELSWLSVSGGGVGVHNKIRALSKKAPGPIPYMKTLDSVIGYYKQGKTRRGAVAYYMDVSHPDIIEHIKFRDRTHGDPARKADNTTQFHLGVNVTDEFIKAVCEDADFDLRCPHSGEVRETMRARDIWETILDMRAFRGEPYLFKIDTANRALPQSQKDLGLEINGSNICLVGETSITVKHKITGEIIVIRLDELCDSYESYQVASKVLGSDDIVWSDIADAAQTGVVEELYEIEDQSGNIIRCTKDHMIFTKNRGYVKACDLVESDVLDVM